MCASPTCSHDDLNDDLDGLFEGPAQPLTPAAPFVVRGDLSQAPVRAVVETRAAAAGHRFEEKCPDCHGTGSFYSWAGRYVGPCFKCDGKGKLTFKSSPEAREKARQAAAAAKERAAAERASARVSWSEANPEDHAWMLAKAPRFEFAQSMIEALDRFGSLTPKQHATVTRLRLADAERQAQWNAERAVREAVAPAIDTAKIEQAFASALSKGVKRPKITLTGIKFSMAPATGRNAGSLYVVATDSDQYLGKITGGRFSKVRECSAEQEAEVLRVAADPHAAAVAHGQRTGNCCICNRELTNHASIDAGVGPICASRFGW